MWKNTGSVDRLLRAVLGVSLIAIVFTGPRTAWGWFGVLPFATALVGWCPLYRLTGWNTARRSARPPASGAQGPGAVAWTTTPTTRATPPRAP
jgi:uncharacterized SAM-binding protein YcdF (DUF218 family)